MGQSIECSAVITIYIIQLQSGDASLVGRYGGRGGFRLLEGFGNSRF